MDQNAELEFASTRDIRLHVEDKIKNVLREAKIFIHKNKIQQADFAKQVAGL